MARQSRVPIGRQWSTQGRSLSASVWSVPFDGAGAAVAFPHARASIIRARMAGSSSAEP